MDAKQSTNTQVYGERQPEKERIPFYRVEGDRKKKEGANTRENERSTES